MQPAWLLCGVASGAPGAPGPFAPAVGLGSPEAGRAILLGIFSLETGATGGGSESPEAASAGGAISLGASAGAGASGGGESAASTAGGTGELIECPFCALGPNYFTQKHDFVPAQDVILNCRGDFFNVK